MLPSALPVSLPNVLSSKAPAARKVYSVSAVVKRADQVLREAARPLWIRGEVSGWKQYPSGHCYFTLKDDQAELCCTLWASAARSLPALPENGMVIEVYGQIGIYAKRGQFQLEVTRLEATDAGGLWEVARERLIARLRSEGLLDEQRKRPLPAYAERIGIVTSSQSAALHDMLRALRRKAWWTTTRVSHCSVEGAGAAPEIAAALRRFGTSAERCPVELVIVARGGGSMESLWAYNMEEVARAIAACPVPVISAVGHETDYTVADFVADVRAATPTAGAELAVPDGRQVLSLLADFRQTSSLRVRRTAEQWAGQLARSRGEVERSLGRRIGMLEVQLSASERHLDARSPRRAIEQSAGELARQREQLHEAMRSRLEDLARDTGSFTQELHESAAARVAGLERAFAAVAEALDARSPFRVLARGYAVVSDAATGRVVRAAEDVVADQRLRVRLAEGEITVRAEHEASAAQPLT